MTWMMILAEAEAMEEGTEAVMEEVALAATK